METIGDRLRRLRRSKEVSQKELSQQINCHQTLISKWPSPIWRISRKPAQRLGWRVCL